MREFRQLSNEIQTAWKKQCYLVYVCSIFVCLSVCFENQACDFEGGLWAEISGFYRNLHMLKDGRICMKSMISFLNLVIETISIYVVCKVSTEYRLSVQL